MLKIYGVKAFRPELKGIIRDLRTIWLAEELGIPYERISLDPTVGENKKPEYLKINPFGKVPTVLDGDFSVFESGAICQFLAEKHNKFIPSSRTPEYFKCIQWCYFAVSSLEPNCARIFSCDVIYEKNQTTADIRKLAMEQINRFVPVLEEIFKTQSTIMKSGFTIADILIATCLGFCQNGDALAAYPNTQKYYANMSARPAFKKAAALNGE